MSLFRFSAKSGSRVSRALIDIGPASVAGACAYFDDGKPPVLTYGKRAPIIVNPEDKPETAMGRTLELICDALLAEGLPTLAQAGAGAFDEALVSIDAPWQQTVAHLEELREERPFTFTKRTLSSILAKSRSAIAEDASKTVEQHVVGVRLNGYPTASPIGKSAHRAALVILISWMETSILSAATEVLRKRLHISRPTFVSGAALRYRALAANFPHEHDLLILDAASHAAAISLVRGHMLVAVNEFPAGDGEELWTKAVVEALRDLAASYPLPHTILLIADEADAPAHTAAIQSSSLGALWLSDNPPKVVVVSSAPKDAVEIASDVLNDIRLALMAEYAALPPAGN